MPPEMGHPCDTSLYVGSTVQCCHVLDPTSHFSGSLESSWFFSAEDEVSAPAVPGLHTALLFICSTMLMPGLIILSCFIILGVFFFPLKIQLWGSCDYISIRCILKHTCVGNLENMKPNKGKKPKLTFYLLYI